MELLESLLFLVYMLHALLYFILRELVQSSIEGLVILFKSGRKRAQCVRKGISRFKHKKDVVKPKTQSY